jgi:hypothetical protein
VAVSTSGTEDPRFEQWLAAIETEGLNLTSWEEGFISDLRDRFDRGWCTLTKKQAKTLERIYSEKTP